MLLSDAKKYVGHFVTLSYRERSGDMTNVDAEVFDIGFVPLYGPCLITDVGEFRLDRVESCAQVQQQRAA